MNINYTGFNSQHVSKRRVWTEEDIKSNARTTTLTANIHGICCPKCTSKHFSKCGKQKGNWHGQSEKQVANRTIKNLCSFIYVL